jgi:aryl-alcohol dehydrogenase-like predicted oxidoreductase
MAKEQRIEERLLGGSRIEVSAIGLGCMSLSGIYGASSDDDGIALIRAALDHGITLLDTSDAYGAGHNEELVGKAIKGRRSEVVLATKFGNLGGRGGKFADGRPEYAASSCEASLKRLGVETIDLYYQHRVDPMVPIEETVGAMARLVAQGKVRALGLSEARPETIRRAQKVHPIAAVQNEFSLLYRAEGEETRRTTRELDIAFVAYSPLGRGLLTAKIAGPASLSETDARRRHPRFAQENLARNIIWSWCAGSRRWRARRVARPANSPSPGCSPRARTLLRSRGRSGRSASWRTSGRFLSISPPAISRASPRLSRWVQSRGCAIRKRKWAVSISEADAADVVPASHNGNPRSTAGPAGSIGPSAEAARCGFKKISGACHTGRFHLVMLAETEVTKERQSWNRD